VLKAPWGVNMNFNDLMAKMRELDQPVPETIQAPVEACGDMPPAPMEMDSKPDTPPPSMSVNINAQGMDDIGELMKLLTKVNPDMINQKSAPTSPMSIEPSITSIAPSLPPLKMLPDLDAEQGPEDNKEEPEIKGLDQDHDGDHDMDDHDAEKKDKDEAFGNSLGDSEPDYKDISANLPNGNDLNRPKKSFSGKPYRGDNPMAAGAYESKETLRANIRAELLQRLAEAKGAK
jgi:hypothetical protein